LKRKVVPPRAYTFGSRDILNDYDRDVLTGIGAVALAWNNLETGINMALPIALCIEFSDWLQVTSRINGFDGKIAIIKHAVKNLPGVTP
jgi:hypothetical protein